MPAGRRRRRCDSSKRGSDRMSYAEFLARKTGCARQPGKAEVRPDDIQPDAAFTGLADTNWRAEGSATDARRCGLTTAPVRQDRALAGNGAASRYDRDLRLAVARLWPSVSKTVRESRRRSVHRRAQYVREWSDVDSYDDHLATVYATRRTPTTAICFIVTRDGSTLGLSSTLRSTPVRRHARWSGGVRLSPPTRCGPPATTVYTHGETDWRNDAETTGRSGCYRVVMTALGWQASPPIVGGRGSLLTPPRWPTGRRTTPASRPSEGFAQTTPWTTEYGAG